LIFALIIITALTASFLTFFSGFGLGTILLPVFALYYPLPVAIALTACVHLCNNLFKLGLVYKNINWPLVIRFGIPSLIAAFAGATLLKYLCGKEIIFYTYNFISYTYNISLQGILIGSLIVFFSFFELSKKLSALTFPPKFLWVGGLLSGFFGGFSGHQGALRSAFLLRTGLEKQSYIATGVFIACLVDVARISLYSGFNEVNRANASILLVAVLSAWVGAFVGNKLFKKISVTFFKWFVGIFMLGMGVLIIIGVI
jgi:uncharacterized protein